ncbi:hypothetical protein BH11PLA2_BH11PLA2_38820 [soil metagenome]
MLRHWQLMAAGVWAAMSAFLFLREQFVPAGQMDGPHWDRAAYITAALALWNVFRWYSAKALNREVTYDVNPLKPKRSDEAKYEYNPELDFQKMDRDAK